MKDQFLIGELAHLFHISTDTLRYYDKIGLIKPDIKGPNGYRYYSMRSFLKLSRILFLKDLNIPLEEVKDYMGNKNTEKLVELLEEKHSDLDLKIQSCLNLQAKIQQKLDLLASASHSAEKIQLKELPERLLLYMNSPTSHEGSETKDTLKRYSHLLKHSSWITEGQIYTSVSQVDLEKRSFQHFRYVFEIPQSDQIPETDLTTLLPSGTYACFLFKGAYSQIDGHYNTLLSWIDANHYDIIGDSIEKNIVDYDFSDRDDEFVSELQIPIQLKR